MKPNKKYEFDGQLVTKRSFNGLQLAYIQSWVELSYYTRSEVIRFKNLGKTSTAELFGILISLGLAAEEDLVFDGMTVSFQLHKILKDQGYKSWEELRASGWDSLKEKFESHGKAFHDLVKAVDVKPPIKSTSMPFMFFEYLSACPYCKKNQCVFAERVDPIKEVLAAALELRQTSRRS
jgi:hypothetical protein